MREQREGTFEHIVKTTSGLIKRYLLFSVLFDEFDRVALYRPIDVSHNLRFLLEMKAGHVVYITATRRQLYQYYFEERDGKDARGIISPLFNYFAAPLYLGLLEEAEPKGIVSFIREPARAHGVDFTNEDKEFALKYGGRHPDLTRLICMRLFEARQQNPQETLDYDGMLYEQAVRDFEPLYHVIWSELPAPQQDALIRLATTRLGVEEVPKRIMEDLLSLGLAVSLGADYSLFSPVLESFLGREDLTEAAPTDLKVWPEQRAVQIGNKREILSPNEWSLFTYLRMHAG